MAAVLEAYGPPKAGLERRGPAPWRWPRGWSEQQILLERQHDRLEVLLEQLIQLHCDGRSQLDPCENRAEWTACTLLLRQLSLHLRLEERWLHRWNALCAGHRAGHRQVASSAIESFRCHGFHRLHRLQWLMDINDWFSHHRHSTDALAYARAGHNANPAALLR